MVRVRPCGRTELYLTQQMFPGSYRAMSSTEWQMGKRLIPEEELNPWLSLFPLVFSLLTNSEFPVHSSCLLRVKDIILQHYSQLSPKSPCYEHILES